MNYNIKEKLIYGIGSSFVISLFVVIAVWLLATFISKNIAGFFSGPANLVVVL
jgi:hypothetical protein